MFRQNADSLCALPVTPPTVSIIFFICIINIKKCSAKRTVNFKISVQKKKKHEETVHFWAYCKGLWDISRNVIIFILVKIQSEIYPE